MTVLRGAAATDVGRVRQVNEDRYLVGEGLYAVADGVGGHQAGEVASQTSVETLAREFNQRTTNGLVEAIRQANRAVWSLAQEQSDRRGMGTTITVLALVEQDGEEQLAIANVGDSRAYLFQRGDLLQVTEDHSLVEELVREGQLTPEEAQVHPQRSIITRALGMEPEIEVDAWTITPYAGDRVLLCSDGLTNELGIDRIAATLRQLDDPQEAARDLVRQARAHGGNDNITVVVVDVVDDGGKAEAASAALGKEHGTGQTRAILRRPTSEDGERPRASTSTATVARPRPPITAAGRPDVERPRRLTWRVVMFLTVLVGVLGVGAATVGWYARSAYFVGLDEGQVAIFRGRPGGFLWFEPTLVDRKEELTVDQLTGPERVRLEVGKEEPSKAAADRYVNNLRQEAQRRVDATTTTSTTISVTPSALPSTTTVPRPAVS